MTELDLVPQEETYRRSRRARRQTVELNTDFQERLGKTKIWPALIWSTLLSLLSIANPFLTNMATNLQTQNLYAGMAMQAGQNPYGDFFATNGVLYYLLAFLGHLGGGFILFGVFQLLALVLAGVYFYKIVAYFSQSDVLATSFSHWFYLFILVLDFGGLYAGIFALPFILTSIWFLIRYFENAVRDEAFILYGLDAALVFLIYPKSLILWLVAGLVLFIFNIQHQRKARGFYQLLASLFGSLLVLYTVGYYTFEVQILGAAIQQTFLYNLHLDFQHAGISFALAVVTGFLVFSGFLKNLVQTLASLGKGRHTYMKVILLLGFILQLLFVIGNPHFEWNQLVLLLPYGFVMGCIHLDEEPVYDDGPGYLGRQFYLPLIVCLGIFVQPVTTYLLQADLLADRSMMANYIREHSESTDKIYLWDTSASVYLDSQRLSAAKIIVAEPYLQTEENQNSLTYDLNKNQARFILVNKNLPLLESVQSNLASQYQSVESNGNFTLYEMKK